MPQDYYPADDTSEESNLPPKDAEKPKPSSETALVPKAMLGDVDVGQTVTMKVVRVYEDEIELEKTEMESEESDKKEYESELDELAMENE